MLNIVRLLLRSQWTANLVVESRVHARVCCNVCRRRSYYCHEWLRYAQTVSELQQRCKPDVGTIALRTLNILLSSWPVSFHWWHVLFDTLWDFLPHTLLLLQLSLVSFLGFFCHFLKFCPLSIANVAAHQLQCKSVLTEFGMLYNNYQSLVIYLSYSQQI